MFKDHYDPDVVDVDALSPWERQQLEQQVPAQPSAQDYAEPDEHAGAGQEAAGTALAVADACLALLLAAQSRDAQPTAVDWPAVLTGLVQRGGAGQAELDGAKAWGLIDPGQHAELLEHAEAPGA